MKKIKTFQTITAIVALLFVGLQTAMADGIVTTTGGATWTYGTTPGTSVWFYFKDSDMLDKKALSEMNEANNNDGKGLSYDAALSKSGNKIARLYDNNSGNSDGSRNYRLAAQSIEYSISVPAYCKVTATYNLVAEVVNSKKVARYYGIEFFDFGQTRSLSSVISSFDTSDSNSNYTLKDTDDASCNKGHKRGKSDDTGLGKTLTCDTYAATWNFDNSSGATATTGKEYLGLHVFARGTGDMWTAYYKVDGYVTYSENSITYTYYNQIQYNLQGGSGVSNSGWATSNTVTSAVPTKANAIFKEWNTKADGTGTAVAAGTQYTATSSNKGPITLYAIYYTNTKVNFYSGADGYFVGDQTTQGATKSLTFTIGSSDYHDLDNEYRAWKPADASAQYGYSMTKYVDASGNAAFDNNGHAVNGTYWDGDGSSAKWKGTNAAEITLHPEWQKNQVILLHANGGIFQFNNSVIAHLGDKENKLFVMKGFANFCDISWGTAEGKAPTRAGYKYAGFNSKADGTGVDIYDKDGLCVKNTAYWDAAGHWLRDEEEVTAYVKWVPGDDTYTITLKDGETTLTTLGTGENKIKIASGNYNSVAGAVSPSKSGYTFAGFYDADGRLVYLPSKLCANDGVYWHDNKWQYAGNATFYARWTKNDATVPSTAAVTQTTIADSKGHYWKQYYSAYVSEGTYSMGYSKLTDTKGFANNTITSGQLASLSTQDMNSIGSGKALSFVETIKPVTLNLKSPKYTKTVYSDLQFQNTIASTGDGGYCHGMGADLIEFNSAEGYKSATYNAPDGLTSTAHTSGFICSAATTGNRESNRSLSACSTTKADITVDNNSGASVKDNNLYLVAQAYVIGDSKETDLKSNPFPTTATFSYTASASYTYYATVTYNNNGGSGTMSAQTIENSATLTANAFTRTGYKFLGWSESSSATTATYADKASFNAQNGSENEGRGPVTLYAVWELASYNVSFNANGGSGSMSTITVGMDEAFDIPSNGFTAPTYTVSFNANGGNAVSAINKTLTFNGWEDHGEIVGSDGNTYSYDNATNPYDAPFYANKNLDVLRIIGKWVYDKYAILGHYISNGKKEGRAAKGTTRSTYIIAERTNGGETKTVSQLKSLTKQPGYTVPLYAQWTGTITLPTATRTGYTFAGWYSGSTKIGDAGDAYSPTATTSLTAHWTANTTTLRIQNNLDCGTIYGEAKEKTFTITTGTTTNNKIDLAQIVNNKYKYLKITDASGVTVFDINGNPNTSSDYFDASGNWIVPAANNGLNLYVAISWEGNKTTLTLNSLGGKFPADGPADVAGKEIGTIVVVQGGSNYYSLGSLIPIKAGYKFLGGYTAKEGETDDNGVVGGYQLWDENCVATTNGNYWKVLKNSKGEIQYGTGGKPILVWDRGDLAAMTLYAHWEKIYEPTSDNKNIKLTATKVTDDDIAAAKAELGSNDNTLIYVDGTYTGSANNVIVKTGETYTCNKYVVTDKTPVHITTAFTATTASYERTLPATWGTICLPFEVKSGDGIQYYAFDGLSSDGKTINFKTVETVEANTPAAFKRTAEGTEKLNVSGESVAVPVTTNITPEKTDIKFIGVQDETVTLPKGGSYYYIADDKFWQPKYNAVTMYPQRAYFTVTSSSGAKALSLDICAFDEFTSSNIDGVNDDQEAYPVAYYDVTGKARETLAPGLNIVRMSNGKSVKIFVK